MNKVIVIVILILLGAAYVGGYWPQHRQLIAAQESASQAQAQLAGAQSVARICHLENDLLALIGQTENQEFWQRPQPVEHLLRQSAAGGRSRSQGPL